MVFDDRFPRTLNDASLQSSRSHRIGIKNNVIDAFSIIEKSTRSFSVSDSYGFVLAVQRMRHYSRKKCTLVTLSLCVTYKNCPQNLSVHLSLSTGAERFWRITRILCVLASRDSMGNKSFQLLSIETRIYGIKVAEGQHSGKKIVLLELEAGLYDFGFFFSNEYSVHECAWSIITKRLKIYRCGHRVRTRTRLSMRSQQLPATPYSAKWFRNSRVSTRIG